MLDALLESSGVHLRRVGGVHVVVADGNGGEEGQPPSQQQHQPPPQEQPEPLALVTEKESVPEGSAHARLHRIQQAEAVAAAAAAATTHAPTPTPMLGMEESELGPAPTHIKGSLGTRSLPCSPNGQRLVAGRRAGFAGAGGGEVSIRFHSPTRLSRLGEGGAQSPPSPESPQQQQAAAPPATRDPAVSVEATPVVLPSAEFSMTPGRRREFKCGARLFGEPLVHLVRDPNTCRLALLDPSLGMPYVFEEVQCVVACAWMISASPGLCDTDPQTI